MISREISKESLYLLLSLLVLASESLVLASSELFCFNVFATCLVVKLVQGEIKFNI